MVIFILVDVFRDVVLVDSSIGIEVFIVVGETEGLVRFLFVVIDVWIAFILRLVDTSIWIEVFIVV